MYRIRLGCAAYARMNIAPDQARRMMYIGEHFQILPLSNITEYCISMSSNYKSSTKICQGKPRNTTSEDSVEEKR